ncbi:hypothetical protein RJT34_15847 [Clitoria ternatea]|uniref:Uncharacterized protein n=1 Tax=Clitoria ternatea TaxID=43366 RepID=A0AAN9J6E5_CLITE
MMECFGGNCRAYGEQPPKPPEGEEKTRIVLEDKDQWAAAMHEEVTPSSQASETVGREGLNSVNEGDEDFAGC